MEILILGGASLPQGKFLTTELQELGYTVILTDTAALSNSAIISQINPCTTAVLDYKDINNALEVFKELQQKYNIKKVFSYREEGVFAAALLNSLIDPEVSKNDYTSPNTIHTIRNKAICREFLRALGYKQPKLWLVYSLEQCQTLITDLLAQNSTQKYIIKPVAGMGSINVFLLPQDLTKINSLQISKANPFIVEEFISGKEFSIEGTCIAGKPKVLAITEKQLLANTFAENGHNMPAILEEKQESEIISTVETILKYLGVRSSVFHAEFWINEQQQVILGEIHARPGGQLISLLTELYSGVQIYSSAITGELHLSKANKHGFKHFAVRSFNKGTGGTIADVIVPDTVQENKHVLFIKKTLGKGAVIPTTGDNNMHEIGLVVIGANTRAELDSIVDKVYAQIVVLYQ